MMETKALAPSTRAGGRWSNFSISGKLMSTCGRARAPRLDHLRQAVQRLRTEDEVDIGRALDDGRALLTRHAAAHADEHALLLQVLDAAEAREAASEAHVARLGARLDGVVSAQTEALSKACDDLDRDAISREETLQRRLEALQVSLDPHPRHRAPDL